MDKFIVKGDGIDPATVHGSYLIAQSLNTRVNCYQHWKFNGLADNDEFFDVTYANRCTGISIGADATLNLGWYIGVLATEYRMLKNHGAPTAEVERDLWNALEAYERLDRMAETLFVIDANNTYSPSFNGFFLRDDVVPSLPFEDANNDGVPNFPEVGCAGGSYEGNIRENRTNFTTGGDPFSIRITKPEEYENTPSIDQVLNLLMGLALVKACVDEGAIYNDEKILRKGQYIAHLIGSYARDHGWNMLMPNGMNTPNRSGLHLYSWPIGQTLNWILDFGSGNSGTPLDLDQDGQSGPCLSDYHTYNNPFTNDPDWMMSNVGSAGGWHPIWNALTDCYANSSIVEDEICPDDLIPVAMGLLFPLMPDIAGQFNLYLNLDTIAALYDTCFNPKNPTTLSQLFTAAAISNQWNYDNLRNQKSRDWGMEIFPLISDVLYANNDIDATTKNICKELIDSAPCDQFCSCNTDCHIAFDQQVWQGVDPNAVMLGHCSVYHQCDPVDGWSSSSRYVHSADASENPTDELYPGLDFLLLYNLYHLKYPEELPTYYGNTYVGDFGFNEILPDPLIQVPNFFPYDPLGYVNCTSCTQDPLIVATNGTMISAATLGAFDGHYAPVLPLPNLFDPLAEATFVADVTYRAGEEIQLTDGFSVTAGASFHAYIDPFECIDGQLQRVGEESLAEWEEQEAARQLPIANTASPALYPNPTTGHITYTGTEAVSAYQIMDLQGRTLHSVSLSGSYSPPGMEGPGEVNLAPASTQGPIQIDLSPYRPGTYLLRMLHLAGTTEVHRIIRQ
jgi:hypothetical protein